MAVSVWVALWRYMAPELWLTAVGFVIFIVDLIRPPPSETPLRLAGAIGVRRGIGLVGLAG